MSIAFDNYESLTNTVRGFRKVIAVHWKVDPSSCSHTNLALKLFIWLVWLLDLKQKGLGSEEWGPLSANNILRVWMLNTSSRLKPNVQEPRPIAYVSSFAVIFNTEEQWSDVYSLGIILILFYYVCKFIFLCVFDIFHWHKTQYLL